MGTRERFGSLPALDGVRGLAVAWVVAFHYAAVRGNDPWVAALAEVPLANLVVRQGYLGVDLFFLLSGFLLVLPWLARAASGEPAPEAREFYRRRIRRIVPAYYVQLVLLLTVALPILRGWDYWMRAPHGLAWSAAMHAAFLHGTTPLSSGSFGVNGALWTLAIEAQFYLLLPLAAPLLARRPLLATAIAFGIAAAWQRGARDGLGPIVAFQLALGAPWQWPEPVVRQLLHTQLPSYLGHFAFGALLARAWFAWKDSPRAAFLAPALGAGGLALLAGALAGPVPALGRESWVLFPLALGLALLGAALGRGVARQLLGAGPLAACGWASYSAYLYHLPLLYVAQHLWPDAGAGFLPTYLAMLAAVSWASWRFIEARFASGLRPQAPRRSPAPAAAPRPTAHGDTVPHP